MDIRYPDIGVYAGRLAQHCGSIGCSVRLAPVLLEGLSVTLSSVQQILMQVGPILSAVLFIIAGIMYSIGQLMPPDKRAQFHSTSVNIIMGAIIVAILSVASTSLAVASSHLLSNLTANTSV